MRTITFDEIPAVLSKIAKSLQSDLQSAQPLYAIRDLWGKVRFLIRERPASETPLAQGLEKLAQATSEQLGSHAYSPAQIMLYGDETLTSPEDWAKLPSVEIYPGPPSLRLIDRQVTGLSWATVRDMAPIPEPGPRRVAFYSLKGGVGRSTATAVAAWYYARKGKTVMILDLDLEAPGLSSSLLNSANQPEFGIADWFVEDAVHQGDHVLARMVARSSLAADLSGDIWVVPSHGGHPGEYIAKLGRCYLDLPRDSGSEPWEQRLFRLLQELERLHRPDIVLLDTRSGLHDLSSAAVTEIADSVLLFAVGSAQTWCGYRLLFEHWQRFNVAAKIRSRFQVVAALVPETNREVYLSQFQEESWNLFVEHLYDELSGGETEGFSFDLDDFNGPHYPLPIYWNRGFSSLTSLTALDPQLIAAAYGSFLDGLDQFIQVETETA
jgi:CO dehydrogenase nickel-insertion accessory protein CooC1